MELKKITEADLEGKGLVGMEDAPVLSGDAFRYKFEEIVRDVVIPIYNDNLNKTVTKEEMEKTLTELASKGDMQSLIYDTDKDGCVGAADNGIFEFSHTYENGTHKLTGHSRASTIKFAATAAYSAGDTFEVNGTPMTAYYCGEDLDDGFFVAGVMVGIVIVDTETNTLHF